MLLFDKIWANSPGACFLAPPMMIFGKRLWRGNANVRCRVCRIASLRGVCIVQALHVGNAKPLESKFRAQALTEELHALSGER